MGDENDVLLVRDELTETCVVRVFSINRPSKRNALNTKVIEGLLNGVLAADEDANVCAIVITGVGGHFSSGGDLREFSDDSDPRLKLARARNLGDLVLLPRRIGTPVIAAIGGATVGGGAALALSADMVIAGEDLRVGFPELVRSIVPTTVMVGLARQVGPRFAFELLATGRLLDAKEALEQRLVNRVVPAGSAVDEAIELARSFSAIDATAMRRMKRLFYGGQGLPDGVAMDAGMDVLRDAWFPSSA
jgi:enoyl-CoA hydratase/carnithine racemase